MISLNYKNSDYEIIDLKWDTEFFGISSGKLTLNKKINEKKWRNIEREIKKYDFVTIVNKNNNSINSKIIAENSLAFLIDINVQFEKKVEDVTKENNVQIINCLNYDQQIINLASFNHSRFFDDYNLKDKNGEEVYLKWIKNSFDKKDKFFALYKNNTNNSLEGFILFSFNKENNCIIELIAVNVQNQKGGIGSKLISTVENYCYKKNIMKIKVGTQLKNIQAINFYSKMKYKYIESNQIYHLWKD